jgi:hypothetical protein
MLIIRNERKAGPVSNIYRCRKYRERKAGKIPEVKYEDGVDAALLAAGLT